MNGLLDGVMQDARYAIRKLIANRWSTAIVLLSIALGVGINTAIFSAVDALLLRPLPYSDPGSLVVVRETNLGLSSGASFLGTVAPADFVDWAAQSKSFQQLTEIDNPLELNLTGVATPETIKGVHITEKLLPLLGVKPLLGSNFTTEQAEGKASPTIMLSYELWLRRFGGDPSVVGKSVALNGRGYTIVGVMTPGFGFPESAEAWLPLAANDMELRQRDSHYFTVVGRLKNGVTLAQAQAEMTTIGQRLQLAYPKTNTGWNVEVRSLADIYIKNFRPAIRLLFGAVLLILLITCANVTNILLGQSSARQKEIAVRGALGASRGRIVRQLLTESVILAFLGGAVGLLLAKWSIAVLVKFAPSNIGRLTESRIDSNVFLFALGVSLLAGLSVGLLPALRASVPDLNESLKSGSHGTSTSFGQSRVGSLLVVSQMCLAMLLLIGAGLLIKSFVKLANVSPGFDPRSVLTMRLNIFSPNYRRSKDMAIFQQQVINEVSRVPGVQIAATASHLPFTGSSLSRSYTVERSAGNLPEGGTVADYCAISSRYFNALSVPLVRGREFTDTDTADSPPVAIISENLARQIAGSENPVGRRIKVQLEPAWREIVGVVGDIRQTGLTSVAKPEIYVPINQGAMPFMVVVARTSSPPMLLENSVREAIKTVNKDIPAFDVATMEQRVYKSVSEQRFTLILLGLFSLMALFLAAVGIYGVISYSITRRTHEIGVRMALGASGRDIISLFLRRGMTLSVVGLMLGMVSALFLTRFISSLLYGITPSDISTFAIIGVFHLSVAALACYLPARRATLVDPVKVLKYSE